MKITNWFYYPLILTLFTTLLSCQNNDDNPAPNLSVNAKTAQLVGADGKNYIQSGLTVSEGNTATTFLVDDKEMTLYIFIKDFAGISKYTGAAATWPKFTSSITSVPSGFSLSDFSTTADGQVTYKGWPLYHYGGDANPGDTKGISVPSPGVWPVVTSDLPAASVEPDVKASTAQLVGADGKNYTQAGLTVSEGTNTTTFLTDKEGRTLYIFINDKNGVSNYTGAAATWPKFTATISNVPDGFAASDFGTTTDGQVTYKGWPLYYYGGDTNPGDTKGVSVPNPGVWPAVTSDLPTATNP
ncbi:MAG TPA: hypothetical protein DCS93_14085 [Microscillaceae bacterium]|nr:hypothetical protein [Microscillaceae bacterium]